MVAEAMSVKLANQKASVPETKKPSWHLPSWLKLRRPAYKALKDADAVPSKGNTLTSESSDIPEDSPLLKKAGLDAAAEGRKFGRTRSDLEDEEPFVPRPNSKVAFNLPDKKKTRTAADAAPPGAVDTMPDAHGDDEVVSGSTPEQHSALIGTNVQPPVTGTDVVPVAPMDDTQPGTLGDDAPLLQAGKSPEHV